MTQWRPSPQVGPFKRMPIGLPIPARPVPRMRLACLLFPAPAFVGVTASAADAARTNRLNIVLLFSDDQTWQSVKKLPVRGPGLQEFFVGRVPSRGGAFLTG